MSQPTAIFPNETYLNGLREADATVVDALYNEFRTPVVKSIEAAGGNYADGATFFRVALLQTAQSVQGGTYPEDAPIFPYLKNLALKQYQAWLTEKGQEPAPAPEPSEEDMQVLTLLPSDEALYDFRLQVKAKRQFSKLDGEDQKQLRSLADQLRDQPEVTAQETENANTGSIERYKKLLSVKEEAWKAPLPAWVVTPLTDEHFHQVWTACEAFERRLTSSQVPSNGENKTIQYAFLLLVVLTLGYAAYTWFFRDRTPKEVYDQNFQPPKSILEDMNARYSKDSVQVEKPEACLIAFTQADAHYQKREWREAANDLAGMMEDSLSMCQSDALFYLAIVGLQLERPELSIECIAKIEDLERFGEDIYWYMALAYVKIAAQDPSEKDIARRAVERALSNTEIPERRAQAEKMLEELAKN